MTNFTIKLSSPNDYEASQPSGGRTDIHRTLQYVLNIGYRRPSFNKVMLNWTMLKCKVKGKTTANNTFRHFTKFSKIYTRRWLVKRKLLMIIVVTITITVTITIPGGFSTKYCRHCDLQARDSNSGRLSCIFFVL